MFGRTNHSNSSNFRRAMAVARDSLSARRRAYRNGNKALHGGQLELAEQLVAEAVNGASPPGSWVQRLGFIQERAGNYETALKTYYQALSLEDSQAEWYYRAGVCARKLGDRSQATELFESAVSCGKGHPRAAKALAEAIPSNTPGWRKLDLLELALEGSDDPGILRSAASLAFSMKRFEQTIAYVDRLERNGNLGENDKILKAVSLLETDGSLAAYDLLRVMASTSSNARARKVGPGYYLDQKHDWAHAFTIHSMEWEDSGGLNSDAAFGAAYALDRQYKWSSSLSWYERAIQADNGDRAYWSYKYAHALERCNHFELAASWYQRAIDLGGMTQEDWFYRLGYCEYERGSYLNSFHALRNYISGCQTGFVGNVRSSDEHQDSLVQEAVQYREHIRSMSATTRRQMLANTTGLRSASRRELAKARLMADAGDLEGANRSYLLHVRHSSEPNRNTVQEVADSLYREGRLQSACQLLLDSREFFRPDGIDLKRYLKTPFERRMARYAEYTQRYAIDDNIVLFETFWGTKIADSPLAIYSAIREDPRFKDKLFYWSIQQNASIPDNLIDDDRTFLVEYGSRKYDRLLATAGTVVNNTSWVQYFSRREGQRYINTWHGTPMKTLGKRIGTGVLEHANVARNFLNVTDFLLPNDFVAGKLWEDYDLSGLTSSTMKTIGSPRLDKLVRGDDQLRARVRRLLGINSDDGRRVVLYAPTWRGSASDKGMNAEIVKDALETLSSIEDTLVLFRAHHLAESALKLNGLSGVIVPDAIDTYDLLQVVDVLVSDYSSLLIDFLVTERPIVCFVPDLEDYKNERGLYIEPSEITDHVALNANELGSLFNRQGLEVSLTQSKARDRFCNYEDGSAVNRVLEQMLKPRPISTMGNKRTLVMFESMIPNGIRSSFVNLTRLVDSRKYDIKVCVDVKQIETHRDRWDGLKELPDHVGVIGRFGEMAMTLEERYALAEFSRGFGDTSVELEKLVDVAYRREFHRTFGHPNNVVFIDFEGYSRFWNSLLCRGISETNYCGLILHNQMDREREKRFPYMAEIIRNYSRYDAVASVSSAIRSDNTQAAQELGVDLKRAALVVHNSIDSDSILDRADSGQNLWERFPDAKPKIVSVGRLSPEKNHSLLIEAMSHLRIRYPKAELLVIGDGPSGATLRRKVRDMGLGECVHFVGFESNPMTTVAESDVFVLTSVHEGQPMVIFEAMTLKVPVLTTPVPGCVEACEAGDGHVVEYDASHIARAIENLVERETPAVEYDPVEYNVRALAEFDAFIGAALSQSPITTITPMRREHD